LLGDFRANGDEFDLMASGLQRFRRDMIPIKPTAVVEAERRFHCVKDFNEFYEFFYGNPDKGLNHLKLHILNLDISTTLLNDVALFILDNDSGLCFLPIHHQPQGLLFFLSKTAIRFLNYQET
jgi:hypothetical protein